MELDDNRAASNDRSIPDIQDQRRLADLAYEDVNRLSDEFHFHFGMIVDPFVDHVIEVFDALLAVLGVEALHAAGAGAPRLRLPPAGRRDGTGTVPVTRENTSKADRRRCVGTASPGGRKPTGV